MHEFFDELGRSVLKRWKQENFSLEKFPQIACKAIDEKSPAKHVDQAALMRDFLLNDEQPLQTDSPFGEPELVVYSHPRFYIQLLFWMDGTTAIHQHEFSGAFHVMQGSSIHAHYEFENVKAVTPYIRVGDVKLKDMTLLEAGRTVPIVSGRSVIHSLFHLDSPSITVVVRTQHDPGTGPQLNYLPPHIAIDPHFSDGLMLRRKQLLDVLERSEDSDYISLVKQMIGDLDFERGFSVLQHCMEYLQQLDEWTPILKAFEKKHGKIAAGVSATLSEDIRRSMIKSWRSAIVEPEHRFFLALLMNAPTRADLLRLVGQRFAKQKPAEVVQRWIEELTEVTDEGVTILGCTFPETVAVDPEAQHEVFLSAFEHFLSGGKKRPAALRGLSETDIEELRTTIGNSVLGLLIS